jgi:uncharacterized protein (TIGR00369 family)
VTQVFDARGDSADEPHVVRRLGLIAREVGDGLEGELELRDDVRAPGTDIPLIGPVGSFCDTIGGVLAAIGAYPTPVATADLTIVLDPRVAPSRITTRPTIARAGRTSVVTEMPLRDPVGGAACGYCIMASTVLSDRAQQAVDPRIVTQFLAPAHEPHRAHFYDELRIVDEGDGAATLALRPFLGNSMGMMHGGVTVMLAEAAAVSAGRAALGILEPLAALEAQVRYLNGARVGPVAARGTVVAATSDSVAVRVEQRDEGRDRLTSVALVRVDRIGRLDTAAPDPRN